jgi:hypothetical protein
MLAQKISPTNAKIIRSQNLDSIQWINTSSPSGLSDREMDLFHLFVSALRMNPGRDRIRCTVAQIARALVSAHVRSHCSPSTVRRSLAGLELRGFVHRRNCRLGSASKGLELIFCLDKWAYWTKSRSGNVSPINTKSPTCVYIDPRQSICQGEDRTSTNNRVNSCNYNNNKKDMHKGDSNKKVYRYHPIVFTLFCCLTKLKAPDRRVLIDRAEIEIKAASSGVVISNHTGIPWEQYSRQWRDMLPPVRESFARSQILPRLRSQCSGDGEVPRPDGEVPRPIGPPHCAVDQPSSPADQKKIRELIRQSLVQSESPPAAGSVSSAPPQTLLQGGELEVLLLARARARSRGIDD